VAIRINYTLQFSFDKRPLTSYTALEVNIRVLEEKNAFLKGFFQSKPQERPTLLVN
jgi:hypothetical protein